MVKIFRSVRQKLLSENKFSKYLLYAIGEIVLVVFGILIALQINNWNENAKTKEFEIKMLNEIKLALKNDVQHFESMSVRMQTLNANADFFTNYIAKGKSYHDSLSSRLFDLNSGISIQYNRGPYDAIKASGIDKISSDSMRNQLIYFYDFLYPRYISSLEHYDRNQTRDIENIVGLQKKPEVQLINNQAQIVQGFPNDIFERIEFLKTLRSIKFRSSYLNNVMEKILLDIENIIMILESEV